MATAFYEVEHIVSTYQFNLDLYLSIAPAKINSQSLTHNHTRNDTRATSEDLRISVLRIIAIQAHTVFRTISNSVCGVLFLVSIMTGIASRTILSICPQIGGENERTLDRKEVGNRKTKRNRSLACFLVPFPIIHLLTNPFHPRPASLSVSLDFFSSTKEASQKN